MKIKTNRQKTNKTKHDRQNEIKSPQKYQSSFSVGQPFLDMGPALECG